LTANILLTTILMLAVLVFTGIVSFMLIKWNIRKKPFYDIRIMNNKLHNF
jgi:hypothetical protein